MTDLLSEIRNWLHTQQDWLQDLADRLLKNGTISLVDIDEIAAVLKTELGQSRTTHRRYEELGSSTITGKIRLVEIGEVKGIDNLQSRFPLVLGSGNLTVIYGNNGAGKSGYTRILKKACGKPGALALRSNVFAAPPTERCCKITVSIDGMKEQTPWDADGDPVEALRLVDIFDSTSSQSYIDNESGPSYLPPPLCQDSCPVSFGTL